MPPIFEDYRIATGYNVALLSLTNIESIKPTGDRNFAGPKATGFYDPGKEIIRGDGTVLSTGFAMLVWEFDVITRLQDTYLRTTYCGGATGRSGKVTIYTTLGGSTYSRMNAVMILPKQIDTDGAFFAFKKYAIKMTRLVAST